MSSCPVNHAKENVNELNLIPEGLDQSKTNLSNTRVHSSIPRTQSEEPQHCPAADGRSNTNWIYPSQEMFYNAMKRKGAEPRPEDMELVVNIHNIVNEQCWTQILKWERMHKSDCGMPKLHRFLGRPDEMSPKAWIKSRIFGYKQPFDRHDWYIDRCGEKVRYVIDFYGGASSPNSPISFHLDVRPALDSPAAFLDRAKMFFKDYF